jgi:hypothetical protein
MFGTFGRKHSDWMHLFKRARATRAQSRVFPNTLQGFARSGEFNCAFYGLKGRAHRATFASGERFPTTLELISDHQGLVPAGRRIGVQPFRPREKLDVRLMDQIVCPIRHLSKIGT